MADKLPEESEVAFTTWVIDCARVHGWRVAHFRSAMTSKGWRTPVQGDGVGFPDLIMVHRKWCRGMAAELKRQSAPKALPLAQQEWLTSFVAAGFEVAVWRPADRDAIVAKLSGK